jgi:hypothetical protein
MPPPPSGYNQPKGGPPANVSLAVRLMLVVAALSALSLIFVVSAKSQIRDAIKKSNVSSSSSHIDTLVNAAIAIAVVIALVFLVLYVLLALQVRKGKNWARIVTWVLAGFGVLGALSSLAQDQPVLQKLISVVQGVIDLVIIILLARGPANDFFRKRTY